MSKNKIFALLMVSIMLISMIAGCAQPSAATPAPGAPAESGSAAEAPAAESPVASGEPIVVGAILPLTGSASLMGSCVRQGMEQRMASINASGGIMGRPLQIIFEDIQASDPALALSAAEKLIHQDGAVAIFGCYGSSASLAVLPVCEENQIPMVEPIATSPALTTGSEWICRISSTNAIDAEIVGKTLYDIGFTKIAYLPVDNDWGLSVSNCYIPVMEALGAETVSITPITIGETNYLSQLTNLKNSGANSVIITQDIESACTLVRQMVEAGITDMKILQSSGNTSFNAYDLIGDLSANSYFVEYYEQYGYNSDRASRAENKEFYDLSVSAGGRGDYSTAQGFLCVDILADAIERAQSTEGPVLRDALRATDRDGLRGHVTFDEFGQFRGDVILTQLTAGGATNIIPISK